MNFSRKKVIIFFGWLLVSYVAFRDLIPEGNFFDTTRKVKSFIERRQICLIPEIGVNVSFSIKTFF